MVKVTLAGGTSELAKEFMERLDTGKHEVVALIRKHSRELQQQFPKVNVVQVNYQIKSELVEVLRGTDVVLCFFNPLLDPEGEAQIQLIDAAIEAGVKRFVPSEWAAGTNFHKIIHVVPWYRSKLLVREYLEKINREKKVIEYTLIAPGLFMDYFAYPHDTTAKHISKLMPFFNFQEMQGFYVEGHEDDSVTATMIEDIVNIVLLALDYEGEWPVNGAIVGESISLGEILKLGQKIKGESFDIELLKFDDIKAGVCKAKHLHPLSRPGLPAGDSDAVTRTMFAGILHAIALGGFVVEEDGWNRLFPDYKFTKVEELLRRYY